MVLTADRTLTAGYRLLFDGMLAASQTTTAPPALLAGLLMPRGSSSGFRAATAPLGLRRIEAALLGAGYTTDDVVVVDDAHLHGAIGPATRIIGISTGEPIGLGMNSTTMVAVAGGRSYPQAMFEKLMRKLRRCAAKRAPQAKIVVGGPGAWQLAGDAQARQERGIDHVVIGYAESNVAEVFETIRRRDAVAPVILGAWRPGSPIPAMCGASTMGVVEISRGCGLGCGFCTIARVPMFHLPRETILADARTNVAAGHDSIAALSEDFFRFEAAGLQARPRAVLSLLYSLREIPGLRLIQIDHANISSIAQFSDEELSEVRRLLAGDPDGVVWVNLGVETASGELLRSSGGAAKMHGCGVSEWGDFSARQIRRLCRAGFFPLVSLMIGLPDETPRHVQLTLEWVRKLADERLAIFPLLHAPVDGTAAPAGASSLHWELIRACYAINFRRVPSMYWDNQRGAGVGLMKRCLMQMLGRGQIAQWKLLLAWRAARSRA